MLASAITLPISPLRDREPALYTSICHKIIFYNVLRYQHCRRHYMLHAELRYHKSLYSWIQFVLFIIEVYS